MKIKGGKKKNEDDNTEEETHIYRYIKKERMGENLQRERIIAGDADL